jgi:type II secretion system protein G
VPVAAGLLGIEVALYGADFEDSRQGGLNQMKNSKGFTLIELLIVVAIIGIIAAIAIPNLLNAIDRGKQKRTMADLRSMGTAIEEYSIDNNFYPTATDLAALSDQVTPSYIRALPSNDGWGGGFEIDSTPQMYTLASCGKGQTAACTSACTGACGPTQLFTDDIIFSNGSFVQWPEGKQE